MLLFLVTAVSVLFALQLQRGFAQSASDQAELDTQTNVTQVVNVK